MQQRNPFDAFDRPARGGMVIQSGPPADPSKEPLTKAQLVIEQARAAQAGAQQNADTRIKNAQATKIERDNADAAADAAAEAAGAKLGPNSQLTGDAYLRAFVPPGQWEMVKSFARGDAGARMGVNRTTLPIIQHAMNYDHSFSMANYPARALMTADLASHAPSSMGNYLSALGAVAAHSKLEERAIAGLDNPSGVVGRYGGAALNDYFSNRGAATGSAFDTANQTFADEKVKAIIASGAGAVADRGAALNEIKPTMAKDAQFASLRTTARQIYDKYREQELKYSRVMGGQSIPMPMRQEDAAQLLHLMRLGDDGKEGPSPTDIDPKFLAFAAGITPTIGGSPPGSGVHGGVGGPPGTPPTVGGRTLATGATKFVGDPQSTSVIDAMLRAGASDDQINTTLANMGKPTVNTAHTSEWRTFLAKNPNFQGPISAAGQQEPTTAWERFKSNPIVNGVGATALGIGDNMLAGTSDEIGGVAKSLFTGRPVSEEIASLNQDKQAAFEANPGLALVGQTIGTIGGMAAMGSGIAATGAGRIFPRLAPIVSDVAFGAASGAGQDNENRTKGAIAGGVEALGGNLLGHGAAKVVGAAARTDTGSAVTNIIRDLIDKAPGKWSPQPIVPAAALTPAEQTLKSTVEKAGTDKVIAALTNGSSVDAPFTLADAAPSLGELAGNAVRRSPAAREFAEPVLTARSQGQIGRMGDAVTKNLGPVDNTLAISRLLSQQAKTDAAPLYDIAHATPTPSTPELDSLLATPFGRESIGKARTIAANERQSPTELGFSLDANGQPVLNPQPNAAIAKNLAARQELNDAQDAYRIARGIPGADMNIATSRLEAARQGMRDSASTLNAAPDPSAVASVPTYTTQALDYAKRGMDDVLEQHRNPITNRLELSDAGRAQNLVKNQLLGEMDRVNPAYADARRAYQGPMESMDAPHQGQDLYGSSVNANQITDSVSNRANEHLAQMQLGYRDAMMDQANKLSYSTNPWNTLNTPAAEAKLGAMYPNNDDAIAALLNQRDVERQMASTSTRVIGGSQTAGRAVADQQFLPGPGISLAVDGLTMAAGGVPMATASRTLAGSGVMDRLKARIAQGAEAKAEALAPMLLNTSPDASTAIVQDLMDKAAKYKAYRDATTPIGPFSRAGAGAAVAGGDWAQR